MGTENKKEEIKKPVVEEKETKEIAQDKIDIIRNQINKNMDSALLEKALQNNILEFDYEGVKYRVVVPSYEQKQNANNKRLSKYMELLRNPDLVMEGELRKLYKQKGIDIDEMDKQFAALNKKKEGYLFKLGEGLKEKKDDTGLKIYREEIEKIVAQQQEISIRKTTLLEYSIEHQIMIYVYSYLTYLVTERKVKDKWEPVWKSYEEFIQDKTNLVNKVTFYASLLISSELDLNK